MENTKSLNDIKALRKELAQMRAEQVKQLDDLKKIVDGFKKSSRDNEKFFNEYFSHTSSKKLNSDLQATQDTSLKTKSGVTPK